MKIATHLSKDSRSPGRIFNPGPPGYENFSVLWKVSFNSWVDLYIFIANSIL
jgi:hypothetical protein